jgi:predicted transcriptional regulator of viral defense system
VKVQDTQPSFETGLLLAGDVQRRDIERQLSRWVAAGRILKLRRGLYALAAPYRTADVHQFLVANRLVSGSYVSCQSALAWHGLIPEHVPVVTSVAARRPTSFDTPLGRFVFRHIKRELLFGSRVENVFPAQQALVAVPEKAILDWIHLEPGADAPEFIREIRLQHTERLDLDVLESYAERTGSPKLRRAAIVIAKLAAEEQQDYESA